MEYDPDFARSFMRRTHKIARDYDGPYAATILINCLLGLLVVPKEVLLDKLPDIPFESLAEWGVCPASITNFGKCDYGHEQPTLRQLVRRMRNAVAHFKIEPFSSSGEVQGFVFKDRNGFEAKLELSALRTFVIKVAEYLENEA